MGEKLAANDVAALLDYRRAAPFAVENHPTGGASVRCAFPEPGETRLPE